MSPKLKQVFIATIQIVLDNDVYKEIVREHTDDDLRIVRELVSDTPEYIKLVKRRPEVEDEYHTDNYGAKRNLIYFNPETMMWNVKCFSCGSIHEQHNKEHRCEKCQKGIVEIEPRKGWRVEDLK